MASSQNCQKRQSSFSGKDNIKSVNNLPTGKGSKDSVRPTSDAPGKLPNESNIYEHMQ
jgi:hypothetical protein